MGNKTSSSNDEATLELQLCETSTIPKQLSRIAPKTLSIIFEARAKEQTLKLPKTMQNCAIEERGQIRRKNYRSENAEKQYENKRMRK